MMIQLSWTSGQQETFGRKLQVIGTGEAREPETHERIAAADPQKKPS